MFPFKENIKNIIDRSLEIYKLRCKGSKDVECGKEYIVIAANLDLISYLRFI